MKYMKLAFIITGQFRSFYQPHIQASFRQCFTNLQKKYELVLFFVINDSIQNANFDFGIPYVVYDISKEQNNKILDVASTLKDNKRFLEFVDETIQYLQKDNVHHIPDELLFAFGIMKPDCNPNLWSWNNSNSRLAEPFDPKIHHQFGTVVRQIVQIQKGIELVKEYEKEHGVFDVVCRSRPDLILPGDFLPYSNDDPFFPHSLHQRQLYNNKCSSMGFDPNEYHMNKLTCSPYSRVPSEYLSLNFGGIYYPKKSIIHDDPFKIMWCYNDYIFLSGRDTFMKYDQYFSMFSQDLISKSKENDIRWWITHESLHILFFLVNQIEFRMYRDDSYTLIR